MEKEKELQLTRQSVDQGAMAPEKNSILINRVGKKGGGSYVGSISEFREVRGKRERREGVGPTARWGDSKQGEGKGRDLGGQIAGELLWGESLKD